MKLLICILLLSKLSIAIEANCNAIVRDDNKRLRIESVEIKDLVSNNSFSGKYVKVTRSISNDPIKFGSKDSLRACTVYYHMSKAHEYFVNNLGLRHLKRPRAIISRIEMDRGYEESAHFMHENNGLFYNNALTIPPSGPGRITDEPWYYEIWFAPKKKVKIENGLYKASKLITSGPFLLNMLMGIGQSQATAIGVDLARGSGFGYSYYLKSLALSIGVTAAVPHVLKWGSKPFKQSIFLDSAMIPEVIYHEYSHYALSGLLSIDRHSPVVEGVANFYAAVIGQTDEILKKAKKYAKGLVTIDSNRNKKFSYKMEDQSQAQLDFTFKFLYALKVEFGEPLAQKLVLCSSKKMGKSDELSLKNGLLVSLQQCLDDFQTSRKDKFKFQKLIQEFGF